MKQIDFTGYRPSEAANADPERSLPVESVSSCPDAAVNRTIGLLMLRFPDQLTLSIEQTATALGVDYETIRRRVQTGSIVSITVGRRKVIPIHELARILTTGVE